MGNKIIFIMSDDTIMYLKSYSFNANHIGFKKYNLTENIDEAFIFKMSIDNALKNLSRYINYDDNNIKKILIFNNRIKRKLSIKKIMNKIMV